VGMTASDWDERYAASGLVWSESPNQFVVEQVGAAGLGDGAGRRALDLACGEGRNAVWLAANGWSVTGVDFSARGIQTAREQAAARGADVEWVVADATDSAQVAGEFDLVVLAYLQLPADQRRAAVRTAVGALAPGGTLVVVAHHSDNLEHGTGGPQHPAVLYTEQDVAADAADAAAELGTRLEVDVAEARDREVAGAERPAIDTVVRLRRPVGSTS
jgi:SAM-dependent methyltransferase